MKTYIDPLDKKLETLTGPAPARRGDRWPTHRAKARVASRTKTGEREQK